MSAMNSQLDLTKKLSDTIDEAERLMAELVSRMDDMSGTLRQKKFVSPETVQNTLEAVTSYLKTQTILTTDLLQYSKEPVGSLENARDILSTIGKQLEMQQLSELLRSVISQNKMLSDIINTLAEEVSSPDCGEEKLNIAKALISDLKNGGFASLSGIEAVSRNPEYSMLLVNVIMGTLSLPESADTSAVTAPVKVPEPVSNTRAIEKAEEESVLTEADEETAAVEINIAPEPENAAENEPADEPEAQPVTEETVSTAAAPAEPEAEQDTTPASKKEYDENVLAYADRIKEANKTIAFDFKKDSGGFAQCLKSAQADKGLKAKELKKIVYIRNRKGTQEPDTIYQAIFERLRDYCFCDAQTVANDVGMPDKPMIAENRFNELYKEGYVQKFIDENGKVFYALTSKSFMIPTNKELFRILFSKTAPVAIADQIPLSELAVSDITDKIVSPKIPRNGRFKILEGGMNLRLLLYVSLDASKPHRLYLISCFKSVEEIAEAFVWIDAECDVIKSSVSDFPEITFICPEAEDAEKLRSLYHAANSCGIPEEKTCAISFADVDDLYTDDDLPPDDGGAIDVSMAGDDTSEDTESEEETAAAEPETVDQAAVPEEKPEGDTPEKAEETDGGNSDDTGDGEQKEDIPSDKQTDDAPVNGAEKTPDTVTEPEPPKPEPTDKDDIMTSPVTDDPEEVILNVRYVSFEDAEKNASKMIVNGRDYCAISYLKVLSNANKQLRDLYKLLAYVRNAPDYSEQYSSDFIIDIAGNQELSKSGLSADLISAALLRTFFSNDTSYDYSMKSVLGLADGSDIPGLKDIANDFMVFKNTAGKGMEYYSDYMRKSQLNAQSQIESAVSTAKYYYQQNVELPFNESTSCQRYNDTAVELFKPTGDVAYYLKLAADNKKKALDQVEEFISGFIRAKRTLSEKNLSSDKINDLIDEAWDKANINPNKYKSTKLVSQFRNRLYKRLEDSLSAIAKWVRLVRNNDVTENKLSVNKKNELIERINIVSDLCRDIIAEAKRKSDIKREAGVTVISATLKEIRDMLSGTYEQEPRDRFFYTGYLRHSNIPLRDGMGDILVPELTNMCSGIDGFDIVSRLEEHGLETVQRELLTNDEFLGQDHLLFDIPTAEYTIGLQEAYGFLDIELKNSVDFYRTKSDNISEVERFTRRKHGEFIENLELSQSYGRFNSVVDSNFKENLLSQLEEVFRFALKTQYYGFYLRAVFHANSMIERISSLQEAPIKAQLVALRRTIEADTYKKVDDVLSAALHKVEKYISIRNYTAAEDMIRRIQNNDYADVQSSNSYELLQDFHNQYETIFRKCPKWEGDLVDISKVQQYVRRTAVYSKDEAGGIKLLSAWFRTGSNMTAERAKELLRLLGLPCATIQEAGIKENFSNYYECTLAMENSARSNFSHILAPFGTEAKRTPFGVLFLPGNYLADRMLNEIDQICGYGRHTIIFVDYHYAEADRRRLADAIRIKNYGKIYMLVDRVLMTYLAAHYVRTSANAMDPGMLMKLAMPFSYYQPYVPDSGNYMPPEMFVGRDEELNKIKDRQGVHLLYGGRQLGKSALLKKAKFDINGIVGQRAVYVDIRAMNAAESAQEVSTEFIKDGLFSSDQIYYDWSELVDAIESCIIKHHLDYLLLLLDEGDEFIASCRKDMYRQIEKLKKLTLSDRVSFKFVIAGLHNLSRFTNESKRAASDDDVNPIIPHLKYETIRPFNYSDARKLLEYPLSFLGIFFKGDEKAEGLISTILATANYFPGLIQFYCSKLVELMRTVPITQQPYFITENYIQRLLAQESFTTQIKDKFSITLALDKDNYYDIIALIMAYLYNEKGLSTGYSADDVKNCGSKEFGIKKITSVDRDHLELYMNEMVDLNIFRKDNEGRFMFSRQNFLQLMGSESVVMNALFKYSEV